MRDTCGFSLLEMMAVITLILILATFAMPIYRTILVRAREATLREDLFTLRSQIDRFTHDNERGPASLEELAAKATWGASPLTPLRARTKPGKWKPKTRPFPSMIPPPPGSRMSTAAPTTCRWMARRTVVGR